MAPSNAYHFEQQTLFGGRNLTAQDYCAETQALAARGQMSEYTPPLTPQIAKSPNSGNGAPATFHNYLRAFHPFHPSSTITSDTEEESVTVPINQGDVILVHTIEPNGWADGTLLESGTRGWLPTNYCEAYDHDMIQNLLDALTHVWEFIRSHEDGDSEAFVKQDYVRAMIAGVRLLLERSDCLTRDAPLVKSNTGLRRLRKSILGDLAAFVKAAKALQDVCRREAGPPPDDIYDFLDSIMLKAFKVVVRSVKFLDLWIEGTCSARRIGIHQSNATPPLTPVMEENPANCSGDMSQTWDDGRVTKPHVQVAAGSLVQGNPNSEDQFAARRTSYVYPNVPSIVDAQPSSSSQKRTSVCHRLSYSANLSSAQNRSRLASVRLNSAQEDFMGAIAVFVGIHVQSRSSIELLQRTQAAVNSCNKLLEVVEEVWVRDHRRSTLLDQARALMHMKLAELVQATSHILHATETVEQSDGAMPEEGKMSLVEAGTSCICAASKCVMATNSIIERIGDFDFEPATGLGISDFSDYSRFNFQSEPAQYSTTTVDVPYQSQSSSGALSVSSSHTSQKSSETVILQNPSLSSNTSGQLHNISLLEVNIPTASPFEFSGLSTSFTPSVGSTRAVSVEESVADSSNSYMSSFRDSETSLNSTASTCMTSPDRSSAKSGDTSVSMKTSGSSSPAEAPLSSADEFDDAEAQLLTTTFAHELVFSKDGQVAGGSLPALVERLTTHDSTPDALFVNTFYLTFRLFTTPIDFTKALIERFDYIGQSSVFATAVRLRVYNVFKGWLESHWTPEPDAKAIPLILEFANERLISCIPSAGKRLIELVNKASTKSEARDAALLVSSAAKTITISSDTPMPNPVVTKSQLNLLRKVESGAASCSILDFDPLELARQFTLIESRIFCSIQAEELIDCEWMKKSGSKAINIRAMSTMSTDLANLVADTILQPEEAKKRAIIVKQWVKIAKKCYELNNYDSLLAIICSLNSSMVSRLKRTWELVTPKTMARLEKLRSIVDCSRNYSNLRQVLQNHVAPCIPFVGIYLTDLTFVDVGNQTTRQLNRFSRQDSFVENAEKDAASISVINFDKHMKTAKIVGDLQRFQIPYRLAPVPEMQDWMESQIRRVRTSEEANVQTFYRRSLLLEPRETQTARPSPPSSEPTTANSSFSSIGSSNSTATTTKEKFELWSARHFPHHHKEKIVS